MLQVQSQNSYTSKCEEHQRSIKVQKLYLTIYSSLLCSALLSLQPAKRRNLQSNLVFRKPGFYPCHRVLHSPEWSLSTSVISSAKHVGVIIRELILCRLLGEHHLGKAPSKHEVSSASAVTHSFL